MTTCVYGVGKYTEENTGATRQPRGHNEKMMKNIQGKTIQTNPEDFSIQINDGLTQTSADGASLVYDKKYGIVYNVYMPGHQGSYGESRGRIALTFFPAAQPENQKTVIIAFGNEVYAPNAVLVSDGIVRCYYLRNSITITDHTTCYRDYSFLSNTLSDEAECQFVGNGGTVTLNTNNILSYLESKGYSGSTADPNEPVGLMGCTIFRRDDDGCVYCSLCNSSSYPVLCRSSDGGITWIPFSVYPHLAQYEFAYIYHKGSLYALCRTDNQTSIYYSFSHDNGTTWSEPIAVENSIQCKPRIIAFDEGILYACNIYNDDTGHRPFVQQGRTQVCLWFDDGEGKRIEEMTKVCTIHSIYGIVNICLLEILRELYMAYSTSVQAMEYQNGDKTVRGKDAIRFLKLGNITVRGRDPNTFE